MTAYSCILLILPVFSYCFDGNWQQFFRKAEVVVMDSGPLPGYLSEKMNINFWAIATILRGWPK